MNLVWRIVEWVDGTMRRMLGGGPVAMEVPPSAATWSTRIEHGMAKVLINDLNPRQAAEVLLGKDHPAASDLARAIREACVEHVDKHATALGTDRLNHLHAAVLRADQRIAENQAAVEADPASRFDLDDSAYGDRVTTLRRG